MRHPTWLAVCLAHAASLTGTPRTNALGTCFLLFMSCLADGFFPLGLPGLSSWLSFELPLFIVTFARRRHSFWRYIGLHSGSPSGGTVVVTLNL